jgi:hypothetical protein
MSFLDDITRLINAVDRFARVLSANQVNGRGTAVTASRFISGEMRDLLSITPGDVKDAEVDVRYWNDRFPSVPVSRSQVDD